MTSRVTHVDTRRWQVAQTVGHVMLDHMLSSGVMCGDSRQHREEMVKHEVKKRDIAAVHMQYCNTQCPLLSCNSSLFLLDLIIHYGLLP